MAKHLFCFIFDDVCGSKFSFGVSMDKQIIFEDEHIRAIFLQGDSNTLVLSFGDLITGRVAYLSMLKSLL